MRKLLLSAIIIILFELISFQCANPITPTGGPKDTIPPVLISSVPRAETINFNEQELSFEFDEFINADQLSQNLIITPFYTGNYKSTVKKRTLYLKFSEPFDDSTTYTLNFANGVTDITEKTPPENFSFSFSTGPYIDSLSSIGSIRSLLTSQKPKDKFTVALYQVTDSTNLVKDKPTYFTKSNELGQYALGNLKTSEYLQIAFNDKNNNLQFDPAEEPHALYPDTLSPVFTPDSTYLAFSELDASELKFISARPSSQYFEIRYSKPISQYSIEPFQYSKLASEKKVIRIYQDSSQLYDSLQIMVMALDTVENKSIDTLYAKFKESSRPLEELKFKTSGTSTSSELNIQVTSNRPITKYKPQAVIALDTIVNIPLNIDSITRDDKYLKFTLYTSLIKSKYTSYIDSIQTQLFPDTSALDSIGKKSYAYFTRIQRNKYEIKLQKGSFISVLGDTIKEQSITGSFYTPESYGTLTVTLNTDRPNYTVHLINKQQLSVKKIENCTTCLFNGIEPGEYSIRIFVDDNNDGRWSPGNILKMIPPETIINFNEFTDLRANWSVELDYEF